MTTETINGLHSCKPGNEPQIGQIKSFVVQHMTSKNGKPYLKIKSANAENGGTPHRILEAEPTGFTDSYGNISFNLGIEPANGAPAHQDGPQRAAAPQSSIDGVQEAREHLMQAANLYVLAVKAVNGYVAAHLPEIARTSEQFQAAVGTLFIEASRAGMVSKMPTKPIETEKLF